MISANSARDLEKTYPFIIDGSIYVTHCGVDPGFSRPAVGVVESFRARYRLIHKPYVLMVGERFGFGGYKNGALAFRALARLPDDKPLVLICVGGHPDIEPQLRDLAPHLDVRRLALSDADLRAAYAGAHALLYPSKYEGFGMPPVESMACGTPAIVCRNSSLPEVVGEAALYVDENDPASMADAIMRLYDPDLRADLVERGLRRAEQFSFANMARALARALVETHDRIQVGDIPRPTAAWTELRGFQQGCQTQGIGIRATQAEEGDGTPTVGAPIVQFTASGELDEARRMIAAMRNSPFWKARELAVRALRKVGLRTRA
jgi:glycosyltransferase involved in cell wall biosynthesis